MDQVFFTPLDQVRDFVTFQGCAAISLEFERDYPLQFSMTFFCNLNYAPGTNQMGLADNLAFTSGIHLNVPWLTLA